jgi:hypothetical protein
MQRDYQSLISGKGLSFNSFLTRGKIGRFDSERAFQCGAPERERLFAGQTIGLFHLCASRAIPLGAWLAADAAARLQPAEDPDAVVKALFSKGCAT